MTPITTLHQQFLASKLENKMIENTIEAKEKLENRDVIWGVGRIVQAAGLCMQGETIWALPGGTRTNVRREAEYAAQMIDKLTV